MVVENIRVIGRLFFKSSTYTSETKNSNALLQRYIFGLMVAIDTVSPLLDAHTCMDKNTNDSEISSEWVLSLSQIPHFDGIKHFLYDFMEMLFSFIFLR